MKENMQQNAEVFFDLISQCTEDYVFIWDIKNSRFKISSSIFSDFNLSKDIEWDVLGFWEKIVYADDIEFWRQNIQSFLDGESDSYTIEYRLIDRNQEIVWVSCKAKGYLDNNQEISVIVGVISNIEKQNKFHNIEGILNRHQFEYRIEEIVSEKIYEYGALVIIDIDNFKNINERYGHSYGDKVLKALVDKVSSCILVGEKLYRLDGDEFAFFYPDVNEEDIQNFFEEIQLYTNTCHEIDGQKYYCTISIGVAMYPKDGMNYADLYHHADNALDVAKVKGKNQMMFFTRKIHEKKLKIIAMQEALKECVENQFNEFELYYQPQVDAKTRKVVGAEALLRWHSPIYGEVSPLEFISLLEENALMIQVGKWVIEQAVQQCKIWQSCEPDFRISVNISYAQMRDDSLKTYLMNCIDTYQLNPNDLVLELTENCWIPDLGFLNKDFKEFRKMGFQVAIDDFGTGYSSLNYLKELPVDVIKIERSFVKGLVKDDFEYIFLESIIHIAHSIHLKVCIEGIEEEKDYQTILPLQPDMIQGFLFGKAINAKEFEKNYFRPMW